MARNTNYYEHIEKLVKDPSIISQEWTNAKGIFQFLSPDNSGRGKVGCISMIADIPDHVAVGHRNVVFTELTEKIRNDKDIPILPDIKISDLHIFKKYQEEYDEMLALQEEAERV